jgi:hypothetical protein
VLKVITCSVRFSDARYVTDRPRDKELFERRRGDFPPIDPRYTEANLIAAHTCVLATEDILVSACAGWL